MPNDTPICPEFASLGESLGAPAELEALTPDESIQISIRPEELDTPMQRYLEDVSKVPPLEAGELEDLTARICGGEEPAAHRLIEARLKLVMTDSAARRRRSKSSKVSPSRAVLLLSTLTLRESLRVSLRSSRKTKPIRTSRL